MNYRNWVLSKKCITHPPNKKGDEKETRDSERDRDHGKAGRAQSQPQQKRIIVSTEYKHIANTLSGSARHRVLFTPEALLHKMAEESGNVYQHGIPPEGMCCLCTMEDITEEDLNYGKGVSDVLSPMIVERVWRRGGGCHPRPSCRGFDSGCDIAFPLPSSLSPPQN